LIGRIKDVSQQKEEKDQLKTTENRMEIDFKILFLCTQKFGKGTMGPLEREKTIIYSYL